MIKEIDTELFYKFLKLHKTKIMMARPKVDKCFARIWHNKIIAVGGMYRDKAVGLVVDERFRGHGYAKELVLHRINLGVKRAYLTQDSLKLYLNHGFVINRSFKRTYYVIRSG